MYTERSVRGGVILSGTHPEFAPHLLHPRDEDGAGYFIVVDTLRAYDHNKKVFMRDCLKKLGLRVAESVDTTIQELHQCMLCLRSRIKLGMYT